LKYRYIVATIISVLVITLTLFIFLSNKQQNNQDESALLAEITDYTAQSGVRYLNDSNPYHLMDVYLPNGDGPFPAIIYIHAGGWVKGNRSDLNATAILYAKRGIAGFSIDYTLTSSNSTAWPENIRDVIAALQFIKENAELYRIDTKKIAVLGTSAGAQLSSLMGTLSGNESFLSGLSLQETIKSQICLVINYAGVTDLKYTGEHLKSSTIYDIIKNAFGNVTYEQNPDLWIEASPATYVSTDDPIFVFVHGYYDEVVPIQIAESFNSKLQTTGVETHFVKIQGDHDIITNDEWNLQARYTIDPLLKRVFDLN
jgi:acetyl esterase/lipase